MFIAFGTGGSEMFNVIYDKKSEINANTKFISISDFAKRKHPSSMFLKVDDICNYISATLPDIVVTERSNGLVFQKEITKKCKELNIHNIVLLDFPNHDYERLFDDDYPDDIFVPTVNCLDALREKLPSNRVSLIGNPAYDKLEDIKVVNSFKTNNIKVLFLGQGELKGFVDCRYKMFDEFHKTLKEVFDDFTVDIKLHPQEGEHKWNDFVGDFDNVSILNYDDRCDIMKKVAEYDLILSFNSTLSFKAHIIGLPSYMHEEGNLRASIDNYLNGVIPIQNNSKACFEKKATNKFINKLNEIIERKEMEF